MFTSIYPLDSTYILNNWKATERMLFESIDLYAKHWSKREQVDLKYISEWKDHLKELVRERISTLTVHFKSPKCKILNQPDAKDILHKLPAHYVLVLADNAASNMICAQCITMTP